MILGRCSRGTFAIDFCTALHRASNLILITQSLAGKGHKLFSLYYAGPFASPVQSYKSSLVAISLHRSKSYSKQLHSGGSLIGHGTPPPYLVYIHDSLALICDFHSSEVAFLRRLSTCSSFAASCGSQPRL
ncbi:hypothetical protein Trisim1_006058 [Trichoderma cf. simile WF8]